MEYFEMRKEFSAFSALFKYTPRSTFVREKISNKVSVLYDDENEINLKINNEKRLKNNMYGHIRDMYNDRITKYELESLKKLPYSPYENMIHINKLKLIFDNDNTSSGKYTTFPMTFYCEKCGNFIYLKKDEFEKFNPLKCRKHGCDGHYTQFHFVGFCEDCGDIIPCYQGCPDHNFDDLSLIRRNPDDLKTWKLRCKKCGFEKEFVPICYHKDSNGNSLFEKKKATRTYALNMNDSSAFKSVVKTIVDIPEGFGKNQQENEINPDYILFGLYLQKFDDIFKNVNLKRINKSLNTYFDYLDEDEEDIEEDGLTKQFERGKKIYEIIETLEKDYSIEDICEINDYLILTSFFEKSKDNDLFVPSYNEYFESKTTFDNEIDLDSFENSEDYNSFKDKYNISNITYIPDIHLISTSIGQIRGINKFYEEGFVPHFEPHWKDKAENKIRIFAYPFQTEGLMIDLDKVKIVNWLIENGKLVVDGKKITEKVSSDEDAKEILFKLNNNKGDSSYNEVKKLLHTFSHVLISRSSLYTGLDVNSCNEIIFPKSGAFVIYSTSNINIGGFKFVFENSLKEWFDKVELDVNDCILDPICIQEQGACFSCLHLPEYVCSEFNEYLDRDVLIGENRYITGFWNEFD